MQICPLWFFFGEISSDGHDPLLLEWCGTDQCDDDEMVKRLGPSWKYSSDGLLRREKGREFQVTKRKEGNTRLLIWYRCWGWYHAQIIWNCRSEDYWKQYLYKSMQGDIGGSYDRVTSMSIIYYMWYFLLFHSAWWQKNVCDCLSTQKDLHRSHVLLQQVPCCRQVAEEHETAGRDGDFWTVWYAPWNTRRLGQRRRASGYAGIVETVDEGSKYRVLKFSLRFNGYFPGEPRLASARMSPFWILLELRVMDVVEL